MLGFTRIFAAVVAGISFLAASLQFNDPDPLRWVLIYGVSGAVALLTALGRPQARRSALVAFFCIIGAAILLPTVWGQVALADLWTDAPMVGDAVERGREMGGLLLLALLHATLYFVVRREPTSRSGSES